MTEGKHWKTLVGIHTPHYSVHRSPHRFVHNYYHMYHQGTDMFFHHEIQLDTNFQEDTTGQAQYYIHLGDILRLHLYQEQQL